ncbi:MAG: glycosyl hydrolase family 18 protein [bacterium]
MRQQTLSIILLIFANTQPGFALQTKNAGKPAPQENQFISIHQIEWQQHKEQPLEETIAKFTGPPMDLVARSAAPDKEIFGYLPYWMYNNYPNLNYDLLTTIAYFGVDINEHGNIVNRHHWPAAGLINLAHSKGVRVVLTVILFVPPQLESLLSDASRRTHLISNLLSQVKNANADGVTIDFEGIPRGNEANLTAFMSELTERFHTEIPGSYVTIFTPAVDWRDNYNYFELAQITDGLVMQGYDFHWSTGPTAGPTAPLAGGTYNVTRTVNEYLGETLYSTSKLILSVPFFGFEWPTKSSAKESQTTGRGNSIFYSEAYPNAMNYGRLWDSVSQTPWYRYQDNGQWHQGWYDDSLSLAKKFELANAEALKGIAIWALGYDGQRPELQSALADAFGSTAAPLKPVALQILNAGNATVQIVSQPAAGATAYKIYQSRDGSQFDRERTFPNEVITLTNLSQDTTYYFKLSAVNGNGESNATEVLAVRPSTAPVEILIVNGFDRTNGTVNTFDFIKRFAPSVVRTGYAFDSCSNEAIQNRMVPLSNYSMVLWISGEEGTADESFSATEQSLVADYLEHGGKLFVSGSEIGYDLVEKGSSADKSFYHTYLKAEYVQDKVGTHSASGTPAGIFADILAATFDNGLHGTYNVDFPDGIRPVEGALLNLTYDGFNVASSGGAGIQYEGTFGDGTLSGKLVYLGFPFETVYPETTRDQIMQSVMDFFDGTLTSVAIPVTENPTPDEFMLAQNYPNPFNPATTIFYRLSHSTPQRVQLKVFNLKGQEIVTLVDVPQAAGEYRVSWNGEDYLEQKVASGVYVYRLQVGEQFQLKRMTLVR